MNACAPKRISFARLTSPSGPEIVVRVCPHLGPGAFSRMGKGLGLGTPVGRCPMDALTGASVSICMMQNVPLPDIRPPCRLYSCAHHHVDGLLLILFCSADCELQPRQGAGHRPENKTVTSRTEIRSQGVAMCVFPAVSWRSDFRFRIAILLAYYTRDPSVSCSSMAFQVAQNRLQRSAAGHHGCQRMNVTAIRRAPLSNRRSCIVAVADITSEAQFEQEVLQVGAACTPKLFRNTK